MKSFCVNSQKTFKRLCKTLAKHKTFHRIFSHVNSHLFLHICQPKYFSLPNSRTVSNKRTGWKICQKIINAQDLINAQAINKTNMTYKVKNHTGWEIFLKLINAQCLISSHRADFFLKKNKRTCATIRQAKVPTCFLISTANILKKFQISGKMISTGGEAGKAGETSDGV